MELLGTARTRREWVRERVYVLERSERVCEIKSVVWYALTWGTGALARCGK